LLDAFLAAGFSLIGTTNLIKDEASMELLNRASDWRKLQRIIQKREFMALLMVHR